MARRQSIQVTHREFTSQATRLKSLAAHVSAFASSYQVLLSEMLLLQAFYSFEIAIEEIAAKIVCGAHYVDGTVPVTMHTALTIDDALTAMRTLNRSKPRGLLKWNQAHQIVSNVQYLIAASDEYCAVCNNHSVPINEMRIIRNHIAHGNADTRKQYQGVVAARLGAAPTKTPRPGVFMLRQLQSGNTLLIEYIISLEAIVKAAVKA